MIPQDKESFGSVTSHEENAIFIFEESRTLLFNQLVQDFLKMTQKQKSFRNEPLYLKKVYIDYSLFRLHYNGKIYQPS
ncbi:hypothetical protein ACTWQL_10525 [Pseudalkalibacillus sp. R45]|uniref:hypothetical protein n=1 Tax=Pseudalkalibacillus sp. R45 TaxID=3457433 RepID=UPI003FCEA5BF